MEKTMKNGSMNKDQWLKLSKFAWDYRKRAHVVGKTPVGAAVMSSKGKIFAGCNIEHQFRSHDIHAEISAISSMISGGHKYLKAIIIAAKRDKFTPCGGCLDWIFQFGGPSCLVGYQTKKGGRVTVFRASDLMPHYPM